MKKQIIFLDSDTVDLGDIDLSPIKKLGDYIGLTYREKSHALTLAQHAEIIITNKFALGEKELAKLPKLKLICVAATGTNNIDFTATQKRKIIVKNVANYSTHNVAEHTLLFLLALSHRLIKHHQAVQVGEWQQSPHYALHQFPYHSLQGKTLGIVGYGHIGKQVAKLAKNFGMQILIAKLPKRKYQTKNRKTLQHVLQKSDYVTLHCQLSSLTEKIMNQKSLSWMQPTSYLLNLSRGGLIDENALANVLLQNKLAGFATDVLSIEPPQQNNPLLQTQLKNKVLITPHIAWASQECRQSLINKISLNINKFYKR